MRNLAAAIALLGVLVASCSSAKHSANSSTAAGATAPSAYVPADGQDAAITAGHIPGCSGVQAESIGGGAQSGLRSAASCTLDGHLVIVDSFTTNQGALNPGLIPKGQELYYASGLGGWLTFLGDPGETASTTTLQMQMTNDAAGLFRQSSSGTKPSPAPVDAQQQIAATIAKDLGGAVEHVTGTA